MSAESCGIREYLDSLVAKIKHEERERAAKIVENWPVESSYVVGKIRLQNRRADIARAIREDNPCLPSSV